MFNISDFLEKFKKFERNNTTQTENILKSIENVVGVKINKKNIVIKNGVLRIQGSPALRQEVFLKKEHLLPLMTAEGVSDIQ
jgi:hypothetical protein